MKLYFTPFACSLAGRIAAEEAGLALEYVVVEKGIAADGSDFEAVSPMGYVPALAEEEFTLSEGPAVLLYLADAAGPGALAPVDGTPDHYRLLGWLNFISTELHKGVFHPLMGRGYAEGERAAARARAARPFGVLARHLDGREHLLDRFSVADAYLLAVLNWCETAGLELDGWPILKAWRSATRRRPSVARAMAAELPLLKAA